MSESGVSPEEVAGISLGTTASTVLAMDEKDRHMRQAILWMDVRASDEARRLQETGDPALKYNGYGAVSAEWLPSKALWLKENERDTYKNARRICEYQDWTTHKLTGEWTLSINVASAKWYHDKDTGGSPRACTRPWASTTYSRSCPPGCSTWERLPEACAGRRPRSWASRRARPWPKVASTPSWRWWGPAW